MKKLLLKSMIILSALAMFSGCATSSKIEASSDSAGVNEIYEVHKDGRIHVFYDRELYKEFMQVGETPFRLIKIAKGPNRETMVFGLTKKDKKKSQGIAAVDLYDGKATAAENFYAEVRKHGRIYVFSNFEDMQPVRQFGHPNFFYMEVGKGPKKETVFYVLNKHTKKKRPVALINTFKQKNNL